MSLETRRERVIYLGVVPVVGAILGAVATSIFQIATGPGADFPTAIEVMKDASLSSADKLEVLKMIKEVSDRPWSVIRTLLTSLTFLVGICAIPIAQRISGRN
jgi:hypothetical protein